MFREPDQRVVSEHGYTSENNEWPRQALYCTHVMESLAKTVDRRHPDKGGKPLCLVDGM